MARAPSGRQPHFYSNKYLAPLAAIGSVRMFRPLRKPRTYSRTLRGTESSVKRLLKSSTLGTEHMIRCT